MGTYKVTARSIGAESDRWYASQVHLANVARADRLREIYGRMAQASVSLKLVITERAYVLEGETLEERDERHQKQITGAMARVGEFGGLILVESSAKAVRDAYQLVTNDVRQYMMVERIEPAGAARMEKLNELERAVLGLTDQVIDRSREHLERLESPVPVRAERSQDGHKRFWKRHHRATQVDPQRRKRPAQAEIPLLARTARNGPDYLGVKRSRVQIPAARPRRCRSPSIHQMESALRGRFDRQVDDQADKWRTRSSQRTSRSLLSAVVRGQEPQSVHREPASHRADHSRPPSRISISQMVAA